MCTQGIMGVVKIRNGYKMPLLFRSGHRKYYQTSNVFQGKMSNLFCTFSVRKIFPP